MVTGDYHHTAVAVAKDIGMIQHDQDIMVIDVANQKESVSDHSGRRTSSLASSRLHVAPPTAPHGPPLSSIAGLPHQDPAPLQAGGARVLGSESMAGGQGVAGTGAQGAGLRAWVQPDEGSLSELNRSLTPPAPPHPQCVQPADTDLHASSPAPPTAHPKAPPTAPMLPHSPLQKPLQVQALVAPSRLALQGQGQGLLEQGQGLRGPHEQLKVVTVVGAEEVGLTHALQSMACGHARCAVTGTAFHHLLQMSDLSILETVMHNAVVFARMKPHQKGQMIDLLSVRGLHQMHLGCARYIQVRCILLCLLLLPFPRGLELVARACRH